jgi:hypothetical protein
LNYIGPCATLSTYVRVGTTQGPLSLDFTCAMMRSTDLSFAFSELWSCLTGMRPIRNPPGTDRDVMQPGVPGAGSSTLHTGFRLEPALMLYLEACTIILFRLFSSLQVGAPSLQTLLPYVCSLKARTS